MGQVKKHLCKWCSRWTSEGENAGNGDGGGDQAHLQEPPHQEGHEPIVEAEQDFSEGASLGDGDGERDRAHLHDSPQQDESRRMKPARSKRGHFCFNKSWKGCAR